MDPIVFWMTVLPFVIITGYFSVALMIFPLVYPRLQKLSIVEDRHFSKILNKWFRYWWIWVTKPFINFFIRNGIHPNAISIFGTFLALISGLCFAFLPEKFGMASFGLAGWIMALGGSMDFMDGWVARETNSETESGAFLDSCLDRVAECFVFVGLAWHFRTSLVLFLVLAGLCGSMLTSYSKCRGDKVGVEYSAGIMQRPERIVYLSVGAILAPILGYALLWIQPTWFENLNQAATFLYAIPLAIVGLLSNYTAYIRVRGIMKMIQERENVPLKKVAE